MPQAPELDPQKVVFRLFSLNFVPDGQRYPNGEAFAPSDVDKADAKKRGIPIRVSVWDRDMTTPLQAKSIWGINKPAIAFALRVSDVIQLRTDRGWSRLSIVSDPLEDSDIPGAEGHCGFEGLDRMKGEPRIEYKTLLDEVAQLCSEIDRV